MGRVITLALLVALIGIIAITVPKYAWLRLPGNNVGYEPDQPLHFSHRLHSGELQIPCMYCHSGAERSRYAGIPSPQVCMNCHQFITAPLGAIRAEEKSAQEEGRAPRRIVSEELKKLYISLGLNEDLKPDTTLLPQSLPWVRVNQLPDFVYFDHRPHLLAKVSCQTCHGPVESMERVRQVNSLSMGWCINCHRTTPVVLPSSAARRASTDCSVCHL